MVRNFMQKDYDYLYVEHDAYTKDLKQDKLKFPDVGNWVVYRCDDGVNKFVAVVMNIGDIVGERERKMGRRISVRKSGETIVTWAQWFREVQSWRLKFAYEWGRVSVFEVYDTEAEALSHL